MRSNFRPEPPEKQNLEKAMFKIKNDDIEGPSISVPVINEDFPSKDFLRVINQFAIIYRTNGWNESKIFQSLQLILSEKLSELVSLAHSFEQASKILTRHFFQLTIFSL